MAKVMIIDDDSTTFDELKSLLKERGYEVVWASSGEEGLKKLKEKDFDVVFLETQLLNDGLAVLRKIKRRSPKTTVVALTAFATVSAAVKAMKEGAFDYVRKPLEIKELQDCVLGILKEINNSGQLIRSGGAKACSMTELLQNGRKGLFISGARDEVDERHGLTGVKKVWIANLPLGTGLCVLPTELDKLSSIIKNFVLKHEKSAVFLHKVEPLINRNGAVTVKFLKKVAQVISSKDSYLIAFTSPERGEALANLISDLRIQCMLEPISNSLRRKIILLLSQQKEASFTEISKKLQIRDSPKLSFHLKKLGAYGIMEQNDEKRYHLTRAGAETVALLGKLADFPGKIFNFAPPKFLKID